MQSAQKLRILIVLLTLPALFLSRASADTTSGKGNAPRVPLAPVTAIALGDDSLETDADHVPDYLRAMAGAFPKSAPAFAHLIRVTLEGGTLPANRKAAMGVVIARTLQNPYAEQHLSRLLRSTDMGKNLLAALPHGTDLSGGKLAPADAVAVQYAIRLTLNVHGVDDPFFARTRALYNDAQIVELTQTVCAMNYFVRYCAALNLQPENWLATTAPKPLGNNSATVYDARVTLASDDEIQQAAKMAAPKKDTTGGLGIGIANSQRAMLRSPELAGAWNLYWQSVRDSATVPRPMLLQVSYAVSMANGCRYCTVHQVVGLRRSGVDVGKLLAMEKDDSALTLTEKTAVVFARRVTKEPSKVTDADFAALQTAFPETQAMEILLQSCAFSYMNRFTDNLGLPSEDEAVKVYREVYGEKPPIPVSLAVAPQTGSK